MLRKGSFGSCLRNLVVGTNTQVLLANGKLTTAVNFDNAATTPPLLAVLNEIVAFSPWYSSVHRGTGYKSILTSDVYEQARQTVKLFVRAAADDVVVFTKSTTEALNLLAHVLAKDGEEKVVLSTDMEHLANDLPWRRQFKIDYIGLDESGRLLLADVESKLKQHSGKVALVAVTGASNVTGYINPVHSIAQLAHKYGAKILVDGAQLVPHMPFFMNTRNTAERIDFLAFSAHKMYAPFGAGVLIGKCEALDLAEPLLWGGGAVNLTSQQFIEWDVSPGRYEAGTPNVMGILALVTAMKCLATNNLLEQIHRQESGLISAAIEGLAGIPGIQLYSAPYCEHERVSLVSFTLEGMHHRVLAEALSQEAGIAVRNGLFCAHPYVEKLLKITESELDYFHSHADAEVPGLVRISLGLYNTIQEVDLFLQTICRIAKDPALYSKKYQQALRRNPRCNQRQSDFFC